LERSRFFKKDNTTNKITKSKTKQLYAQVSVPNVSEILKLKKNFPNLLAKKIENIHKTINNFGKIKMTTKSPSKNKLSFLWITIIKSNS